MFASSGAFQASWALHLLIFYWPEQVTLLSPESRGRNMLYPWDTLAKVQVYNPTAGEQRIGTNDSICHNWPL